MLRKRENELQKQEVIRVSQCHEISDRLRSEEFYHYEDQTHTLIDSFMGEQPPEAVDDNEVSPFEMPICTVNSDVPLSS